MADEETLPIAPDRIEVPGTKASSLVAPPAVDAEESSSGLPYAILEERNDALAGANGERLLDYDALYAGGEKLEARLSRLLPLWPYEEPERYALRKQIMHFEPYAGTLLDYFVSWLFTGEPVIKTRDDVEPDAWYRDFKEDCDRNGADLDSIVRSRVLEMLKMQRSWLLVDFPKAATMPTNALEHERAGLKAGYVVPYDAFDVLDWEYDGDGKLLWALVKTTEKPRRDPRKPRSTIVETWTIYAREGWERYRLEREIDRIPPANQIVPLVEEGPSPTPGEVPLVCFSVNEGLWAMNRLASIQKKQFRKSNALEFSMQQTCYAMRIFHLDAPLDEPARKSGPGRGLTLGTKERVEWDAPPTQAFTPIIETLKIDKDEIYRLAAQMALGVDNNAAAIGRSGESKQADAKMAEVVLVALGKIACAGIERLHDLLAIGRGETGLKWHVTGFNRFADLDATGFLANATGVQTLDVPSPTFQRDLRKEAVRAVLPRASADKLATYDKEIDAGIADEQVAFQRAEEARQALEEKKLEQPKQAPVKGKPPSSTIAAETK